MRKKLFAAIVMAILVICQSAFAALPDNIVSGPLDTDLYDPNYNWWENEVLLESASEYTQKANPAYNERSVPQIPVGQRRDERRRPLESDSGREGAGA